MKMPVYLSRISFLDFLSLRKLFGAKKFTKLSAPDRIRSVIDITKTRIFRSLESRGDFSFFCIRPKFVEILTILIITIAMAETEDAMLCDIIGMSAGVTALDRQERTAKI
jgi:hypothetical protein